MLLTALFCTGGGATPPKDAGPGWMQKSSDAVANGYSAARRSASQATGLEEGTHWFEGLLLVVVLLCCCRKYYQRRQANAAPSWTKCEPLAIFSLCSMTMLWQCPLTSARPSQDQDEGSVRARGQRRLDGGRRGGASDVGRPRAGAGARSQDGLLAVRQHLRPRRHITGRCTGALLQVRHLPSCVQLASVKLCVARLTEACWFRQ